MAVRIALLALLAACAAPPAPPSAEPKPASPPAAKADPPGKTIPVPPKDETLGQCLARKGVHLYGASWCHPCHVQLEWFGKDAKNVPFTDCFPADDTVIPVPECEAVGLDLTSSYPTWIFPDGLRVVGTRSLKWLAISAECPLR
ncbi:MAG TPA: hypothetical protein VJ694_02480 [Patescibacteria group bacterium]|nr:hypothetical protein [Patescibacteria group bacterium]